MQSYETKEDLKSLRNLTNEELLLLREFIQERKKNRNLKLNDNNINRTGYYGSVDEMHSKLCNLVDLQRNNEFISLLSCMDKYNYDINYSRDNYGSILMYCIRKNNNYLLSYILSTYKDIIKLDNKYLVDTGDIYTAYEYANILGFYHLANLIRLSKLGVNLRNKIKNYENKNEKINGISKLFNYHLKLNCNKYDQNKTYDRTIGLMEDTLISLINNKRPFSNDIFKIVWDYNISKYGNDYTINDINKMKLWIHLKKQLQSVLNIKTISRDKLGWYWFKNNLLDNNIWLFPLKNVNNVKINERIPLLYDELIKIVNTQLNESKIYLKDNMSKLISKNKKNKLIWNNICKTLIYTSPKFKNDTKHRQDCLKLGVKNRFDSKLLINNENKELSALYDYNNYLCDLIINGNILNNNLKNGIEYLLGDYIKRDKCFIQFGAVKSLSRCQEKSQLDYNNSKFPTSSSVIDIIRCSATFDDLPDYYSAIVSCINTIMDNKCKDIINVVRMKNGFNRAYLKETKGVDNSDLDDEYIFIPNHYSDIKLNVVVSNGTESIIGEIQFLIQPMLDNKKETHELYEIKRINEMLNICGTNLPFINNINNRLQIAVTSKNKNDFIKLLSNKVNLNDIENKLDNSLFNRTLLMQCIVSSNDLSLFNLLIQNISLNTKFLLCDKENNNILHYIFRDSDDNNVNNVNTFGAFCDFLVKCKNNEIVIKLLTKKNNNNKTPVMYSLERAHHNSINYVKTFAKIVHLTKNNTLIESFSKIIVDLLSNFKNLSKLLNDKTLLMLSLENNSDLSLFYMLLKSTLNKNNYKGLLSLDKNNSNVLHYMFRYSDSNTNNNSNIFKQFLKLLLEYDKKNNYNVFKQLINQKDNKNSIAFNYSYNNMFIYRRAIVKECYNSNIIKLINMIKVCLFNNSRNKNKIKNLNNVSMLFESVFISKNLLLFKHFMSDLSSYDMNNILISDNNKNNILHYITEYTRDDDINVSVFRSFIKLLFENDKNSNYKNMYQLLSKNNSNKTPFEDIRSKYTQAFYFVARDYKNNLEIKNSEVEIGDDTLEAKDNSDNERLERTNLNKYKPKAMIIHSVSLEETNTIKVSFEIANSDNEFFNKIIVVNIEYKTEGSNKWNVINYDPNTNNETKHESIISNLLQNKKYLVRISGKNILNLGDYSKEYSVTTTNANATNNRRSRTNAVNKNTTLILSNLSEKKEEEKDSSLPKLEGWLLKKHAKLSAFGKRYVIVKGNYIFWNDRMQKIVNPSDKTERQKFKGCLNLMAIKSINPIKSKSDNKFNISLANIARTYIFKAQTTQDRDYWVNGLKTHQNYIKQMTEYLDS